MSRSFLVFFGVGCVVWVLYGVNILVETMWVLNASLVVVVSAPFLTALVHWRKLSASPFASTSGQRSSFSPFSNAVAGLVASGALFYIILWSTVLAHYSCAPDDLECQTVGSQWELSLAIVAMLTLIMVVSATLGALLLHFRSQPRSTVEP